METLNNYQQGRVKGKEQQTIVLDSSLTAETDELDPKFDESDDPQNDPDYTENAEAEDGEGIRDDFVGEEQKFDDEDTEFKEDLGLNNEDDNGLNHNEADDLSLNT